MNWITVSLIFLCASVFMYLAIRHADTYHTPIEIKNLVMFAFPIIPLLLYNISLGNSILIDINYLVILFLAAIFLAWIASIASLIALREAPNQGYSLILSKSYVVYTTIFAIIFLGAELSYFKIGIIFLIVLFSGLILYERSKTNTLYSKKWIYLSIYAFFARGNLSLLFVWLGEKGLSASIMNLYLLSFTTIFIIGQIIHKKLRYKIRSRGELLTLIAIGTSFIIFQQSNVLAITIAPNPGYVNAVNTGSIGIITLLSGLIFKDHLNVKKLIGVAGVIVCICLLFL